MTWSTSSHSQLQLILVFATDAWMEPILNMVVQMWAHLSARCPANISQQAATCAVLWPCCNYIFTKWNSLIRWYYTDPIVVEKLDFLPPSSTQMVETSSRISTNHAQTDFWYFIVCTSMCYQGDGPARGRGQLLCQPLQITSTVQVSTGASTQSLLKEYMNTVTP